MTTKQSYQQPCSKEEILRTYDEYQLRVKAKQLGYWSIPFLELMTISDVSFSSSEGLIGSVTYQVNFNQEMISNNNAKTVHNGVIATFFDAAHWFSVFLFFKKNTVTAKLNIEYIETVEVDMKV